MNLVVMDSYDVAGDNGEYFFRKARDIDSSIDMVFLLSEESNDWDRLKNDGFNLCAIQNTKQVLSLMNGADFVLFARHISEVPIGGALNDKTIFMQHGVLNDIHTVGFLREYKSNYFCRRILCSSESEVKIVEKYRTGTSLEPLLLGIPRHDLLLEKNEMRKRSLHGKNLLINFHWRYGDHVNYLMSGYTLKKSQYATDINSLLNSQLLKTEFVDRGFKVRFLPHLMFRRWLNIFEVPDYIEVPVDAPFQDVLVDSDVLITDFSSNSFEMAYMDKPTVCWIPGMKDVLNGKFPMYDVSAIQNHSHITYCETMDAAISTAHILLDADSPHDFARDMFRFVDSNNTKRLVDWMSESLQK